MISDCLKIILRGNTGWSRATCDFQKRGKCVVSLVWSDDAFGHVRQSSLIIINNGTVDTSTSRVRSTI